MMHRKYRSLPGFLIVFFLFTQQLMAAGAFERIMPQRYLKGIFWKIEKPGTPPSYLLGTVHVDHPEIMALLQKFKKQFDSSSLVCTEVLMNYQSMAAEMRAMYFSDGRTLRKVINDDVFYRKMKRVAAQRGFPAAAISDMKPWAVMYMLSMPDTRSMEVLDMKIYTDAQRQGKQVCGLEKIDQHSNAFNVFSMQDQVEMLRLTVDNLDKFQGLNTRVMKVYLAADLKAMTELINESPGMKNTRLMEKFIQRLVIDRNRIMLQAMKPHLVKGGGFFAVGAMHLTGEAGLLRQVESLGYKLTRIY